MPVFTDTELRLMEDAVRDMYDKHTKFERHGLSVDELYELFCSPEDVLVIKRAVELVGPNSLNSYSYLSAALPVDGGQVTATVQSSGKMVLPKTISRDGAIFSQESPLRHRLVTYAAARLDICLRYSRVRQVLVHLTNLCELPAQVQFLWPTIDAIASRVGVEKHRERLLTKLSRRTRANMLAVSPELREACRDTAATVAAFLLLPDQPPGGDVVPIIARPKGRAPMSSLGPYELL